MIWMRVLLPIIGFVVCLSALADAPPGMFQAGAATSNITPPLGASLAGHLQDRISTEIHDELHARCLVLDNGETRVALVTVDSCMVLREVMDEAKALAEAATGIPAANILIAATHSHTAPAGANVFQTDPDPAYLTFLATRIADGIRRAVNHLAPAEIAWGSGTVADEVFNRRWHLSEGSVPVDPFGGKADSVKMNPPRMAESLLRPAGPTDPQVPFIAVRHADGRPLAIWSNYALHYVGGTGAGDVSADYFGYVARALERHFAEGETYPAFVAMHSNGTSGDINNINFQAEGIAQAPYEQMQIVADKVAAAILASYDGLTFQSAIPLIVAQRELALGVRKADAAGLAAAKTILEAKGGDPLTSLPEIYARETVLLDAYPDAVPMLLQAIRIGDGVIASIPCEVFVEIGLALKSANTLSHAMVVELANGYNGYLPTKEQHTYGGYETWRARSSYLEVAAAEKISVALIEMMADVSK